MFIHLHSVTQAATAGVLWALDRGTFRAIVVAATMQKRVQNESILDNMAVFASLTPENRAAIADCLTPQVGFLVIDQVVLIQSLRTCRAPRKPPHFRRSPELMTVQACGIYRSVSDSPKQC